MPSGTISTGALSPPTSGCSARAGAASAKGVSVDQEALADGAGTRIAPRVSIAPPPNATTLVPPPSSKPNSASVTGSLWAGREDGV